MREFCRLADLDPSNWSKVERGIFPPPRSRDCITDIASVLLIEKGSDEWNRLFDLAAVGHIPAGLLAEPVLGNRMNVFFRLNRVPAPADRIPIFANQFIMNRVISPKEISLRKPSRKPEAKPAPKPGSVRSSRGAKEKKK